MAKVLGNNLEVREFEIQSRYYIHFWFNMGKVMNPLISKQWIK